MGTLFKRLFLMLILTGPVLADDSGVITENIHFTTMDGEEYDLFSMLDEGKHVFTAFIKIFF